MKTQHKPWLEGARNIELPADNVCLKGLATIALWAGKLLLLIGTVLVTVFRRWAEYAPDDEGGEEDYLYEEGTYDPSVRPELEHKIPRY